MLGVLVRDSFTGENGTLLQSHIADSGPGHDWVKRTQTGGQNFTIQDGKCQLTDTPSNATRFDGYHVDRDPESLEDEYEIDVTAQHSHNTNNDRVLLHVRMNQNPATRTFYELDFGGNPNWGIQLKRFNNGTLTVLVESPMVVAHPVKLKLYARTASNGNVVLRAYVNGELWEEYVDTSANRITSRGRAGIGAITGGEGRTVTFEDFRLGVYVQPQDGFGVDVKSIEGGYLGEVKAAYPMDDNSGFDFSFDLTPGEEPVTYRMRYGGRGAAYPGSPGIVIHRESGGNAVQLVNEAHPFQAGKYHYVRYFAYLDNQDNAVLKVEVDWEEVISFVDEAA